MAPVQERQSGGRGHLLQDGPRAGSDLPRPVNVRGEHQRMREMPQAAHQPIPCPVALGCGESDFEMIESLVEREELNECPPQHGLGDGDHPRMTDVVGNAR